MIHINDLMNQLNTVLKQQQDQIDALRKEVEQLKEKSRKTTKST